MIEKCHCEECAKYSTHFKNNCNFLNDLSYSGCTCDIHCEPFQTHEEYEELKHVLDLVHTFGSIHHKSRALEKSKTRYAELKQQRIALQNV